MKLKKGVRIHGISNEMAFGVMIIAGVYADYGKELVITSVVDGKHHDTSLHYKGDAIDTRTRYFDDMTKLAVAQDIRDRLDRDFDVIVENNHLHIQYKPHYKRR